MDSIVLFKLVVTHAGFSKRQWTNISQKSRTPALVPYLVHMSIVLVTAKPKKCISLVTSVPRLGDA